MVDSIMEELAVESARKAVLESTWKMLREDPTMKDIILIRLRMLEEDRARSLYDKLVMKENVGMYSSYLEGQTDSIRY